MFDRWGARGTVVVFALSALVLLLIGATVGLVPRQAQTALGAGHDDPAGRDSVDVGFPGT